MGRRGMLGRMNGTSDEGSGGAAADAKVWHRHYDDGVPTAIDYEPVPINEIMGRAASRWARPWTSAGP